jgi:hypothetical protein
MGDLLRSTVFLEPMSRRGPAGDWVCGEQIGDELSALLTAYALTLEIGGLSKKPMRLSQAHLASEVLTFEESHDERRE